MTVNKKFKRNLSLKQTNRRLPPGELFSILKFYYFHMWSLKKHQVQIFYSLDSIFCNYTHSTCTVEILEMKREVANDSGERHKQHENSGAKASKLLKLEPI